MPDHSSPTTPNAFVDGATRLIGLLGWPVEHSFSPAMQNAALRHAGLNYVYVALPVEPASLTEAVAGLRAVGAAGWNVTIPHKQAVIPLLDELSPAAAAIGAVNCVVNHEGRLTGHNTDVAGFVAGLSEAGWEPGPAGTSPALVLGAGGAARAVVWGLAAAGIGVKVLARRAQQAEALIAGMKAGVGVELAAGSLEAATLKRELSAAGVLVNSTPAGMWPHEAESPLPAGVELPPHLLVYDLIYHPRPTLLLRQAAARGCRTQDGLAMLINQGVEAFQLWTGHRPDRQVMANALRAFLP